MNTPQQTAKEIIEYYREKGNQEYGEQVTMIQHMVQSARLAAAEGYEEEVVLAAFLHDIGHFFDDQAQMGSYGTEHHDEIGARYLRDNGFSEKLVTLVEGHVTAKRYLTFVQPQYYNQLSEASKATLVYQGGPMTEKEAKAFEATPHFELCVKMRYWDDGGKTQEAIGMDVLVPYEAMIIRHLEG